MELINKSLLIHIAWNLVTEKTLFSPILWRLILSLLLFLDCYCCRAQICLLVFCFADRASLGRKLYNTNSCSKLFNLVNPLDALLVHYPWWYPFTCY
jgi:hypothetical protein